MFNYDFVVETNKRFGQRNCLTMMILDKTGKRAMTGDRSDKTGHV